MKRSGQKRAQLKRKDLHVRGRKGSGGEPSDNQLARINEFAFEDLSGEDVYVRTFDLAHNGIDRDREVFPAKLLEDFARTLPGRGFFVVHPNHPKGDPGPAHGLWFEARVETMSHEEARERLGEPDLEFTEERAAILEASAYVLREDDTEYLRKRMDAGIARYVSIGFDAHDLVPATDAEGGVMAAVWQPPGEAREGSLVWLGAQQGAQQTKSFDEPEGEDMDKLKLLEQEVEDLKSQVSANQKAADLLASLKKALGVDELPAAKDLARLYQAGKQYRERLLSDIVREERFAKVIGDTDEDAKDARDLYGDMPTDRLEKHLQRLQERNGASNRGKGQMGASDPNADDGYDSAGEKDDLRDEDQTKSALA